MKKTVLSLSIAAIALPAVAADKVTYVDHILPIFRNACLNCHNPDKKKAGLDLTTYKATMSGSENGPVLKPGQADGSLLFKVCAQTEDPKMPPKGDKLTDADLGLLKNWIAGFALETSSSKPAAAAANQVALAVVSLERPDGPPPMPGDLPLEPIVQAKATNAVTALAASPWAPLVAIGGQKQIVLYNTETLQRCGVLPFPEGFPTIIRFSRNGQLLLTGGGLGGKSGKVVLWNVLTGERIGTVGDEVDQVLAADVSPDHAYVALGGPTRILKIYSTKDGSLLHSLKKHTDWVTAVSFSPDGKFLASADRNGGVMVWEGATGKEYQALAGHKQAVTALAFMPGVLASASTDGKISLWNVKEGNEMKNWVAHNGGVEWIDFTPDGRLVSCGRDKYAKAWDATGKNLFTSAEFGDITLRAALNSERVIAGDWTGRIKAFALDGKPVGELPSNPPPISEQLAGAQKLLVDAETALPAAQKNAVEAESKIAAEKAAAEKRSADAKAALEQLKASIPSLEKQLEELKANRTQLVATRDTAAKEKQAAAAALEEKTKANAADVAEAKTASDAKVAALVDAEKKVADIEAPLKAAEENLKKTRAEQPAKIAELEKAMKESAALLEALNGAPAATPPAVKDEAKIAAARKKVEDLNAEIVRRREARAKTSEGSAEYAKTNDAVQAIKPEIAKAEADLAAAEGAPPKAVEPQRHPLLQGAVVAKAALDQATSQIATAKSDVEHWTRALSYMAVHRAQAGYTELKDKLEELQATAKDALRAADQVRTQINDLSAQIEKGPAKVKEAEAALAQTTQARDAAQKAVADAEAVVAEKSKVADPKAAEAAIAEASKKVEELNAEIARRREARGKLTQGTPEYQKADADVQSIKPEIATAEQAVAAAKANAEKMKAGPSPELVAAQEAVKKAQLDAKLAAEKVAPAEQAVAKVKKSLDDATAELNVLKGKAPEIVQTAKATKAKAEKDAAALVKDVEKAKSEAQKVRADFDAKWHAAQPGVKTASAAPAGR